MHLNKEVYIETVSVMLDAKIRGAQLSVCLPPHRLDFRDGFLDMFLCGRKVAALSLKSGHALENVRLFAPISHRLAQRERFVVILRSSVQFARQCMNVADMFKRGSL